MKKILFCLGLSLFLGFTSSARADDGGSVTLRSVVASKYILDNGEVSYDKPVTQTDLSINFKNGLYIDLWNSVPFKKDSQTFGNEEDFGLGWSGTLFKFIDLDLCATYCDEPRLMTMDKNDVLYSYIKLSKTVGSFVFSAMDGNYKAVLPDGPETENFCNIGICGSGSFFKDHLNVSASIVPTYDTGEKSFFAKGSLEFDWKLIGHLSLVLPKVDYYYVPVQAYTSRSTDKVFFGGLSYQF